MTETLWPTKPKILTPCPFMEKAHMLISDLDEDIQHHDPDRLPCISLLSITAQPEKTTILTSILEVSFKHACFTGQCPEHSKGEQLALGRTAKNWQSRDMDPGGLAPELMFLFRIESGTPPLAEMRDPGKLLVASGPRAGREAWRGNL